MARAPLGPPPGAVASTVSHRVAFYETDAMGIVHHANYVRFLELARVRWMDEHHRPYREYMAEDLHFATTRVELDYHRSAKFDDELSVTVWPAWVRGASLRMDYELSGPDGRVVSGGTEHAMVDGEGRLRRIPREHRDAMRRLTPAGDA